MKEFLLALEAHPVAAICMGLFTIGVTLILSEGISKIGRK